MFKNTHHLWRFLNWFKVPSPIVFSSFIYNLCGKKGWLCSNLSYVWIKQYNVIGHFGCERNVSTNIPFRQLLFASTFKSHGLLTSHGAPTRQRKPLELIRKKVHWLPFPFLNTQFKGKFRRFHLAENPEVRKGTIKKYNSRIAKSQCATANLYRV